MSRPAEVLAELAFAERIHAAQQIVRRNHGLRVAPLGEELRMKPLEVGWARAGKPVRVVIEQADIVRRHLAEVLRSRHEKAVFDRQAVADMFEEGDERVAFRQCAATERDRCFQLCINVPGSIVSAEKTVIGMRVHAGIERSEKLGVMTVAGNWLQSLSESARSTVSEPSFH